MGPNAQFNLPLKGRVKGDEVGPVLAQLILYYKENRSEEESFNRFVARVGVPAFQELLNGILAAS
ncbi:hypothetical protein D3C76_1586800 [compost metagenome]